MDDRKPWGRGWDMYLEEINYCEDDEFLHNDSYKLSDLRRCSKDNNKRRKENLDSV